MFSRVLGKKEKKTDIFIIFLRNCDFAKIRVEQISIIFQLVRSLGFDLFQQIKQSRICSQKLLLIKMDMQFRLGFCNLFL